VLPQNGDICFSKPVPRFSRSSFRMASICSLDLIRTPWRGCTVQVDFGRLGLMPDPARGTRRVEHGLIFTAVAIWCPRPVSRSQLTDLPSQFRPTGVSSDVLGQSIEAGIDGARFRQGISSLARVTIQRNDPTSSAAACVPSRPGTSVNPHACGEVGCSHELHF
jgi:hypothetical protein